MKDLEGKRYDTAPPLVLSLWAEYPGELEDLCIIARKAAKVVAIELNLSCPNQGDVKEVIISAGRAHGGRCEMSAGSAALGEVLPPVSWAPGQLALAAQKAGADAVVFSNTFPAMVVNTREGRSALGSLYGGASGEGLFPVNLAIVDRVAQVVQIPVIACGGISSGSHVLQYMMAGATAVQMGTHRMAWRRMMAQVKDSMERGLGELKVERMLDLIGTLERSDATS